MENTNTPVDAVEGKRLERQKQTTTERLIEMLIGMPASDPRFVDRLKEDKLSVRSKYHLPPEGMREQEPREYYRRLLRIAKTNGLKTKPKEWDPEFFLENPGADAKFEPDTMTIVVDLEEESEKKYRKSLHKFEHELVHGLQLSIYPNMPIEVREYEAYVVNAPIKLVEKSSPGLRTGIFGGALIDSVLNWYKRQGVIPGWDNPEWFLRNIDKVEI